MTPQTLPPNLKKTNIQTLLVFFLSSQALSTLDPRLQFLLEVLVMVVFSGLLFQWLFLSGNRSLHLLVLVGIVCGVLFRSVSGLLQRMLDPNEFLVLQDTFFASFNSIDSTLLGVSFAIVALASLLGLKILPYLDVLSLGRPAAISLGVPYKAAVSALLAIIIELVGGMVFIALVLRGAMR